MDKEINGWDHDKFDMFDPNSAITKALMLIYSMETSFYGTLNWICRKEEEDITDDDYEFFGPYAFALCTAINAERSRYDRKPMGIEKYDLVKKIFNDDKLGFFSCSFLLFRGLSLP